MEDYFTDCFATNLVKILPSIHFLTVDVPFYSELPSQVSFLHSTFLILIFIFMRNLVLKYAELSNHIKLMFLNKKEYYQKIFIEVQKLHGKE